MACGALVGHVLEENREARERYGELRKVLRADPARFARRLLAEVGMKEELSGYGVRREDFERIVAESLPSGSLAANPVPFERERILRVLEVVTTGRKMKPTINAVSFGTITIDGREHTCDVVILPSGEVIKRKTKVSKKKFGTGHRLSRAELAGYVREKGKGPLIVGTGHSGMLELSGGAVRLLARQGINSRLLLTRAAAAAFNKAGEGAWAIIHVTC